MGTHQSIEDGGSLFDPSGLSCAVERNMCLVTPCLVQTKMLFCRCSGDNCRARSAASWLVLNECL